MVRDDGSTKAQRQFVTDSALILRRRRQIGDAALELFGRQGFHQTTMQDVAALAGVSPGLIYQYCEDKHDVLLLVLLRTIEDFKTELSRAVSGVSGPLLRFTVVVDAYCRTVSTMAEATVLLYRSTKTLPPERRQVVKDKEQEATKIVADCIKACVEAGVFRKVNAGATAYQITMYAHSWALKNWALRDLTALDDYIKDGIDFFIRGLRSDAAALPTTPPARRTAKARPE